MLVVLSLTGFGLHQIEWTSPQGEPVSVALIQGNIPQEMKFRPEAFIRTLNLYRDLIDANPAQLTLLPETAFPAFLDQLPEAYIDALKALAGRQNGDIILGTLTGDNNAYYNSAISLGTSPLQVYSKSHLVPYGEFIPPGFAWFMAYANIPASSFSRGPEKQAPLAVAGQRVAANICYEDVFGSEIIRTLPEAGILANLSNTAWFGDSLAQPQHLQNRPHAGAGNRPPDAARHQYRHDRHRRSGRDRTGGSAAFHHRRPERQRAGLRRVDTLRAPGRLAGRGPDRCPAAARPGTQALSCCSGRPGAARRGNQRHPTASWTADPANASRLTPVLGAAANTWRNLAALGPTTAMQ